MPDLILIANVAGLGSTGDHVTPRSGWHAEQCERALAGGLAVEAPADGDVPAESPDSEPGEDVDDDA